jgi:hypothetical protein
MAQQHIDKLGQFIQASIAQEFTDPGHPGIIIAGLPGIRLFIDIHRPEFIAPEDLAKKADSFLSEKCRTAGIQSDKDYKEREQPGKDQQDDGKGS